MFTQITKLFRKSQKNNHGQEHLQKNQTANVSDKETNLVWQPLDITKLNITSSQLRQIEASIAEKTRAEFAAVTNELNTSQNKVS